MFGEIIATRASSSGNGEVHQRLRSPATVAMANRGNSNETCAQPLPLAIARQSMEDDGADGDKQWCRQTMVLTVDMATDNGGNDNDGDGKTKEPKNNKDSSNNDAQHTKRQ